MGRDTHAPNNVKCVRFHPYITSVAYVFQDCTQLISVVLNEGIWKIGDFAFAGCVSLNSIILPSTVTEIGKMTFMDCYSLQQVVLNEGLIKIGNSAFSECTSISSIALPSTVTEIGSQSFCNCRDLRNVAFNEGLETIGNLSFLNCELKRITLPSTLKQIGSSAFSMCRDLRNVAIHNEGIQIGDNAFFKCEPSTNINFPSISSRLEVITGVYNTEIINKIESICSNECPQTVTINRHWNSSMELVGIGIATFAWAISNGAYWKIIQRKVYQISNLIRYYEVKEAATLFELALWKAKIDQSRRVTRSTRYANHSEYRIEVPGPVKDLILQYAYPILHIIKSLSYVQGVMIRSIQLILIPLILLWTSRTKFVTCITSALIGKCVSDFLTVLI